MEGSIYKKRAGTTDEGKRYENFVTAQLILQLVLDDTVDKFELSSDDPEFGAFDDIVVEIDSNKQKKIYAMQLKHFMSNKRLSCTSFQSKSGSFSLIKYFESSRQISQRVKPCMILYTNQILDKDTEIQVMIDNMVEVNVKQTESEKNFPYGLCFKFEIKNYEQLSPTSQEYKTFFENFFLYTNQLNAKQTEMEVKSHFENIFSCSSEESDKFLQFISKWSIKDGKKYKLDKSMMRKVIALSALHSSIKPVAFTNTNHKMILLRQAINNFDVTIIQEESYDEIKYLCSDLQNRLTDTITKKLADKFHIDCFKQDVTDIDLNSSSKLLWLLEIYPLIVSESQTAYKIINVCEEEKFILVAPTASVDKLSRKNVFQKLSDLQNEDIDIFEELTNNFTCKINETDSIPLQELVKLNINFVDYVTTADLLKMADDRFYVQDTKEDISQAYINRSISVNDISIQYLANIDASILVFIDFIKINDKLKQQLDNFNCIDIRDFTNLHLVTSEDRELYKDSNQNLYICGRKCTSSEFGKVVDANPGRKKYHHFRFRDNDNLEWIQTNSEVDDLEQFRTKSTRYIDEGELYIHETGNNINLVSGDPGMGKSEFLKNLRSNYRIRPVTVMLDSKDITILCSKLTCNPFYVNTFVECILEIKFTTFDILEKKILEMFIKEGQTCFFWDALDEISHDKLEVVTEVILKLSQTNPLCVHWISCRSHLRRYLQKKLKVLSRTISCFNDDEQTKYIRERLKHLKNVPSTLIEKIKHTLSFIKREEILGTPLQIYMLTEFFSRNLESNLHFLDEVISLTDLYNCFLEEKFNVFFNYTVDISYKNMSLGDRILQTYKTFICENYEKAALKLLLPNVLDELNIQCEQFLQEVEKKNDCIGIITKVIDGVPYFNHISYAEYFVATYFFKHYELMHDSFDEILFEHMYDNVRFFFDLLLAKSSPEHRAVLYKETSVLRQSEARLQNLVDDGGRNVLHLVCSWGQRYSHLNVRVEDGTFYINDENDTTDTPETVNYIETLTYLLQHCDINQSDGLFNYTPLDYAKQTNCLYAKLKLLQKQGKVLFQSVSTAIVTTSSRLTLLEQETQDDDKDAARIFYYSAKFGYEDAIDNCGTVPFIRTETDNLSILHMVIKNDRQSFLQKLLEFDIYKNKINEQNELGETLLYKACEYGRDNMIVLLIKKGALTEIERNDGWSLLHVACAKGHIKVVVILIEYININIVSNDDVTPLHTACLNKHLEVVEFLITKGANFKCVDVYGWTPLHMACQEGNEAIAELLLDSGADVDALANNEWTPLHKACQKGHINIVQLLIDRKTNINQSSTDGTTPLHVACTKGHIDIVRLLRNHEEFIRKVDNDGCSPLYKACQNGFMEVVSFFILIDKEDLLNDVASNGKNPLHAACENGHNDVVQLLIQNGMDIGCRDNFGWTPLHVAAQNGDRESVRVLLEFGADVNAETRENLTVLHIACQSGHSDIVSLLITNQADINACGSNGWTPLHVASKEDWDEVANILIDNGANKDATDNNGYSPIHLASENGCSKVVRLLIAKGANIDAVTSKGRTAINLASRNGHNDVVKILTNMKNITAVQTT